MSNYSTYQIITAEELYVSTLSSDFLSLYIYLSKIGKSYILLKSIVVEKKTFLNLFFT